MRMLPLFFLSIYLLLEIPARSFEKTTLTPLNSKNRAFLVLENDNKIHLLDEEAMCFLEEHIPEMAAAAIKQAYWQTLVSGNSVLICRNGILLEVFPDGSEKMIKELPSD